MLEGTLHLSALTDQNPLLCRISKHDPASDFRKHGDLIGSAIYCTPDIPSPSGAGSRVGRAARAQVAIETVGFGVSENQGHSYVAEVQGMNMDRLMTCDASAVTVP